MAKLGPGHGFFRIFCPTYLVIEFEPKHRHIQACRYCRQFRPILEDFTVGPGAVRTAARCNV